MATEETTSVTLNLTDMGREVLCGALENYHYEMDDLAKMIRRVQGESRNRDSEVVMYFAMAEVASSLKAVNEQTFKGDTDGG